MASYELTSFDRFDSISLVGAIEQQHSMSVIGCVIPII